MLNDTDIDLEELESRLYSQIHHANSEDAVNIPKSEDTTVTDGHTNMSMNKRNRYFQLDNVPPSSNSIDFNNARNNYIPLGIGDINPSAGMLKNNDHVNKSSENKHGDMSEVHMFNPFNNIVVIPQIQTQTIAPNDSRVNRNLEKFLERQAILEKKKEKRKFKRLKLKLRKKELKLKEKLNTANEQNIKGQDFTAHYMNPNNNFSVKSSHLHNLVGLKIPEIIDISDSDSSSCVEISNNEELVVLSCNELKDDETNVPLDLNSKENILKNINLDEDLSNRNDVEHDKVENREFDDDDIIFIEPKPKDLVIIDLDADTESTIDVNKKYMTNTGSPKQTTSDKSTETNSTSSEASMQTPKQSNSKNLKQVMYSKERKELLSTPDSSLSYDFLDSSVNLQDGKFNFSLHGTDFGNSHGFLKPKSHTELYETESSCSASDISTPVKNTVFNEVEFEPQNKEIFDSTNIEKFVNYITPVREKLVEDQTSKSFEQVQTKANKKQEKLLDTLNDSDSSSESEYENNKVSYLDKMKKALPTLSPIQSDDENNRSKNKEQNINSKNVLNNDCVVNMNETKRRKSDSCEENKTKKNKKNTKKDTTLLEEKLNEKNKPKNEDAVVTTGETLIENDIQRKDDETLCKKRKSESCEENKTKKNKKNTKKDTSLLEEKLNDMNKPTNEDAVVTTGETLIENDIQWEDDENVTVINVSTDDEDSSFGFGISDLEKVESDLKLANCDLQHKQRNEIQNTVKRKQFADYWCSDMESYYKSTEDLKNFSVTDKQRSMSDDPNLWRILDRDRIHIRLGKPKGIRCHRCREFGHILINCPNRFDPLCCTLCGIKGHTEPRCPTAMCTSCGSLGGYTTYCTKCAHWKSIQCTTCRMYGHYDNKCPDLWRRYHLTTTPGPIVKPKFHQVKPRRQRWCSGCSMSGHYEHTCRFYNRLHPPTDPEIKRYVDVAAYSKAETSSMFNDSTVELYDKNLAEKSIKQVPAVNLAAENTYEMNRKQFDVKSNQEMTTRDNTTNFSNIISFKDDLPFPPLNMIPPYFQEQLSYLKTATNKRNKHQVIHFPDVDKSDYKFCDTTTLNFIDLNIRKTIVNDVAMQNRHIVQKTMCDSKNSTAKINLDRCQYGYIHSMKGIDSINDIRRRSTVNITITNNDDDFNYGGNIFLQGNQNEVRNIHEKLNDFIKSMPRNILPLDSKLAYIVLRKNIETLEKADGNCKQIYDCILQKERELKMTNPKRIHKLSNQIRDLYARLHMLLFGRCNVNDGNKHVTFLQTWLNKLQYSNPHELLLNNAYDIYESFSYIFNSKLQKEDYRSLAEAANYHIKPLHNRRNDEMTKKEKNHFLKNSTFITRKCKVLKMYDKLQELHSIQDDVIKSDYSRHAYRDFMKFVRNFLKKGF